MTRGSFSLVCCASAMINCFDHVLRVCTCKRGPSTSHVFCSLTSKLKRLNACMLARLARPPSPLCGASEQKVDALKMPYDPAWTEQEVQRWRDAIDATGVQDHFFFSNCHMGCMSKGDERRGGFKQCVNDTPCVTNPLPRMCSRDEPPVSRVLCFC